MYCRHSNSFVCMEQLFLEQSSDYFEECKISGLLKITLNANSKMESHRKPKYRQILEKINETKVKIWSKEITVAEHYFLSISRCKSQGWTLSDWSEYYIQSRLTSWSIYHSAAFCHHCSQSPLPTGLLWNSFSAISISEHTKEKITHIHTKTQQEMSDKDTSRHTNLSPPATLLIPHILPSCLLLHYFLAYIL